MIIGACQIELHLPHSGSLKAKRQVLKGLKERLRNHYNISVAEVEGEDLWQRATLGVAVVTNNTRFANQILSQVIEFIQKERAIDLLDYEIEMR